MPIDPQLDKVITSLIKRSKAAADDGKTPANRPWMNFVDVRTAGRFSMEELHQIFDRSSSNDEYVKNKTMDGGQTKEMQTAKLSCDILGTMERDYRMLRRSRIRLMAHAAAHHKSEGDNNGMLNQHTIGFLGRMLSETSVAQE